MSAETASLTPQMWIAGAILVAVYILIFTEIMHRTSASVIGAVAMVGAGIVFDFYTQRAAMEAIDGNTLMLLLAMMMLVAMLRPTGGFEYLAIRLAKLASGDPRRLLIFLTFTVSALSMFLDNVTTVLIFAPLTVLITRMLNLNPAPFLVAEAMLSNISGASTLVGDPPNIMIGSSAGLDFVSFLTHMGPVVLPAWLATLFLILILFRKDLQRANGNGHGVDLDETHAIRDMAALRRILLALAVVIVLFFIHHRLHLFPAYVAWLGLAIALVLLRPNPESLFPNVAWSVLLFFAALFIIAGGLESSGLLHLIGQQLARNADDPAALLRAALVLMWVAAILSAFVDNIPFTVTMIPIVAGLEAQGTNVQPLWWALAIGVGLGGNATHIGATANVVCIAEAERSRHPGARISPLQWLRAGAPVMALSLGVATLIFTFSFAWFVR